MTNEVATNLTFEQRIFERIRGSLGELMSDEDLKRLVEAAMQKAFHEPRTVSIDRWGDKKHAPPLITEAVNAFLASRANGAIQAWLEQNPDVIGAVVKDAIAKGVLGWVQSYMDQKLTYPLQNLMSQLQQQGVIRP